MYLAFSWLYTEDVDLKIDDRIKRLHIQQANITIKGYKTNVHNNPEYRLLNFTENNTGKLIKAFLKEHVNTGYADIIWQSFFIYPDWFGVSVNRVTVLWNLITKFLEVSKLTDIYERKPPEYWKKVSYIMLIHAGHQNSAIMTAA